jgi:multicomponent Na+:H+ antiporter subunit G
MVIVGWVFVSFGGLFMLLGALGLVRMPDVFNRLQAGTKATTLGFLSIVVGAIVLRPDWWSKLLVVAGFVLLTNPIGSHNLARASHGVQEKRIIEGVDRLEEAQEGGRPS